MSLSAYRYGLHGAFRLPAAVAILLALCLLCSCDLSDDDDTFVVEGTVRFSAVELGCWFILATDGTRYEPVNLPEDLKQDGLFVRLIVRPRDDAAGICMVGRLVEIVRVIETGQGRSD